MQHFFSFSRKLFFPNFEINLSRSIEFTNSIIDEDGENEKGREERGEIGAVSLEAEGERVVETAGGRTALTKFY